MKRIFSLILLSLIGVSALLPQTKNNDYIDNLIDSSNYLLYRQSTDACKLAQRAYKLAIEEEYRTGKIKAARILGLLEKRKRNWEQASNYIKDALGSKINDQDIELLISLYNEMAAIKEWEGKLDSAFYFSDKAIQKIGNRSIPEKGYTYMTRGNLFRNARDSASADLNFKKAAMLFNEIQDSIGAARSWYNWAAYYYDFDNYSRAEQLLNNALDIFTSHEEYYWMSLVENVLGTIRLDQDQFGEAKRKHTKSIKYAQTSGDSLLQFDALLNLSLDYFYSNDLDSAIVKVQEAEAILGTVGGIYDQKYLAEVYAMIFEKKGDYANAYKYLKRANELSENLYNRKVTKAVENAGRLESEIEIEKKEKIQTIVIAVAIIFFFIAIFSFRYAKQKAKTNFLILQQNEFRHQKEIGEMVRHHQIDSIKARLKGEKKERDRIAMLLHDRITSQITAIRWRLEGAMDIQKDQLEEKDVIQSTVALLKDTHKSLRVAVRDLERNNFDWIDGINKFCRYIQKSNKIQTKFYTHGLEKPIDRELSEELFDIVLQLVANVLKHAQATKMNVSINYIEHEEVNLIIEDDGKGFTSNERKAKKSSQGGNGLKNIEKKVSELNGTLSIDSNIGTGTTTSVVIPVK